MLSCRDGGSSRIRRVVQRLRMSDIFRYGIAGSDVVEAFTYYVIARSSG